MEWTRDKTLALINEYKKRRGLWDMTHDDYRKKEMKQKLLAEVSISLGDNISVVEIEKKFHTLRTQYHREINRMKRKEPYNSKWFGFKNLQFLSSPKACRMGKGRIKSEITEDGTVTKYIIRETTSAVPTVHDTSGGSVGASSEEYNITPRKPKTMTSAATTTTVTYEATSGAAVLVAAAAAAAASTSRSRELEKLIEETTKDVDEVEEPKPKMSSMRGIALPLEQHTYNTTVSSNSDMSVNEQHVMHAQHTQQHQIHQDKQPKTVFEQHHQHQLEEEHVETIDIQTTGDEITYQTSNSPHGVGDNHHTQMPMPMPTHIIKIQRRDTCQEDEDEYYDDDPEQQHHQQVHQIHALPASTTAKHRIYYESNGQHHTAILTPTAAPPNASSTLISSVGNGGGMLASGGAKQRSPSGGSQQLLQQQQQNRDEFSTYGEYVANEMRGITKREIMIALKHKINTALFEANMAELQK